MTLRCRFQHRLNPLHVYCRLRELGVPGRFAVRVASVYERLYRLCLFRTTCDKAAASD